MYHLKLRILPKSTKSAKIKDFLIPLKFYQIYEIGELGKMAKRSLSLVSSPGKKATMGDVPENNKFIKIWETFKSVNFIKKDEFAEITKTGKIATTYNLWVR